MKKKIFAMEEGTVTPYRVYYANCLHQHLFLELAILDS